MTAAPEGNEPFRVLDYGRAYTRLCHLAALTAAGQVEAALDNLVATSIALSPENARRPVRGLANAVFTLFGLSLPDTDLDESLGRLSQSGRLSEVDDGWVLSDTEAAAINRRAADSAALERQVREQWLDAISKAAPPSALVRDDQLWAALQGFMGRVFRRHGAQTLLLLEPDLPFLENSEGNLDRYLVDSLDEAQVPEEDRQFATDAIRLFFNTASEPRTRYLTQLLDGTFTFYALTVDEATSEFLRGQLRQLNIFLDTNFIFAVIGLHEDYFAEVSAEVLDLIQKQKLPFRLYYHERTLKEIEQTIFAIGNRLRAQRWSQALSAAAFTFGAQTGALSGVELNYHRLNAKQPIDPEAFLSKYEHIEKLLETKGFRIYREGREPRYSVEEKGRLIAEYESFAMDARPERPRRYEALDHDVTVLLRVEELRESPKSILDAGAVLLTNDFLLHRFVWRVLRGTGELGMTVLPRELLQVLRPFVRTTDDFDRRFVETFAIPEFRGMQKDISELTSKVLGYLASYQDLQEDTALKLLSDAVLQNRGRRPPSETEFREYVDSEVLRANSALLEEREELLRELDAERARTASSTAERVDAIAKKDEALAEVQTRLTAQQSELAAIAGAAREAAANQRRTEELEAQLRRDLEAERSRRHSIEEDLQHQQDRARLFLFTIIALLGTLLVTAVCLVLPIPWISTHPKRLGLAIAASLVVVGCAWLAVGRSYRLPVGIGVVVAGLYTAATLIDVAGSLPLP